MRTLGGQLRGLVDRIDDLACKLNYKGGSKDDVRNFLASVANEYSIEWTTIGLNDQVSIMYGKSWLIKTDGMLAVALNRASKRLGYTLEFDPVF